MVFTGNDEGLAVASDLESAGVSVITVDAREGVTVVSASGRKDRVEKHIMRTLKSIRFEAPQTEATAVITGNKKARCTSTR